MSGAPYIKVSKNGPYIVYGPLPVALETIETNDEGGSWDWKRGRSFEVRDRFALCRCGHSSSKPFCDGTHARIGFDGTEVASRLPYSEQASEIDGATLTLQDAESLCAYARFCDVAGTIWALVEQSDSHNARDLTIREAAHCPSGRLVVRDKKSGKTLEPEFEPSIGVVEDPSQNCSGPLWVRGAIRVESADGTSYEVRNRVTLCRCGESANKPFCDGKHAEIGFKDGL